MKVVLMGPPHSGKSVFREGLKQAICLIDGAPYPYIITGCPDGEGSWFQETASKHPELAKKLKEAYKGKFTPEFVKRIADSVKACPLPLVIVDIGGIPSKENEIICGHATHAIILAGDERKIPEWREFCSRLGLKILAEIKSDYNGTEDVVPIESVDGVFRGSVHHLERGEMVSGRPTIQAVAKLLVKLAT